MEARETQGDTRPLSPFQFAYHSEHFTGTALLRVQNDVQQAMDRSECVSLGLLDMSAAFVTV